MKAYDLEFPGIHGSESTDAQLSGLVSQAGYSSTRGMINDFAWWDREVSEIKADLRNMIAGQAFADGKGGGE